MSWGDSFSLGALMNTRGLAELIVLNLGYRPRHPAAADHAAGV